MRSLRDRRHPVSLVIGLGLLAASSLPAAPRGEVDPLDLMLQDFRKDVDAWLKADTSYYQSLKKGSPRALIRWQGQTLRFPPLPDMEPPPDELGNTYPLAALPPEWIDTLNEIGETLFNQGLEDGRSGEVSPAWVKFQDELERMEIPRKDIPSLSELAPGWDPEFDYRRQVIPFEEVEEARAGVEEALEAVSGGGRRSILQIPDDDPAGGEIIGAFRRYEGTARNAARALREKLEGILKRRLLQLRQGVYDQLYAKLKREPKAKDVNRFGRLMSKQWRKLIRWNHARHYFAGFRATAAVALSGGGTGDGKTPIEFEGTGTGDGSGATSFQGTGTGDGSSSTPPSGGGTGDGTVGQSDPDAPGTGTGEDDRGGYVAGGTGG